MALVYLTRRERFNAAHRMYNPHWNNEENLQFYGKCSNPLWHGHNYELYVTIKGHVNPSIGFLVNLTKLSELIKEAIINKVDHRNINLEVDFMQNQIVSSENLAIAFWNELAPKIKSLGAQLHCIKLVETENNYVEYYGE